MAQTGVRTPMVANTIRRTPRIRVFEMRTPRYPMRLASTAFMLRRAIPSAEEIVRTAVLRTVVSSDSIKKATAMSQRRSRLADAVGSDEKGLDEEVSDEDGGAINRLAWFIGK